MIIFQTTIGRGRGRPVGLLGDSPGFGPQQPYTGGYNQMVDHSYDPYENASYGGGYNYGQDLASKFGAMSLGNNMAGGDNVQNRVMNPHTGKLYIRKQGKSHYKMPLNKWIGKDLFTLRDQYHGCWCPGDARSQGSSSHGIDQFSWNIPVSAPQGYSCDDQ